MRPILAIDIGSNTVKCLLATAQNGHVTRLYERSLENRIMSRGGELVENAAQLISDSIKIFIGDAKTFAPDFDIEAVATSALRDYPHRREILDAVFSQTNCAVKIIDGDDEARLSFLGAMSDPLLASLQKKRCAYFDLGGGSLEIVAGENGNIAMSKSLKLGAVRLTRECSSVGQYSSVSAEVISRELFDFPEVDALIGAGGAVVAARFMKKILNLGGAENIIGEGELKKCLDAVLLLTIDERIQKFSISANRAEIIPAAFATILELMKHLKKKELFHTFCNMRYGMVLSQNTKASKLNYYP